MKDFIMILLAVNAIAFSFTVWILALKIIWRLIMHKYPFIDYI